ncbi:uncharacterized protein METZ01_LOCUS393751 [marine metagenome]|uniref:Uncharacterized protein n=1 Tax=marine metagenome TaxID=408172 RepID=A0A382V380_9ZZZZ
MKLQEIIQEIIQEGADFMGYYKAQRSINGKMETVWTFPDGFQNKTGHLSNNSARMVLDTLGLDSYFEEAGPIELDKFINISTQWLRKHLDKQSAEIPTISDENPGGATMVSVGREEGYMNNMIMAFNKEARRFKSEYPEVTHVAFA